MENIDLIVLGIVVSGIYFALIYVIIKSAVKSSLNSNLMLYNLKKNNYLMERYLVENFDIDLNTVIVEEIETGKKKTMTYDEYISFVSTHSNDKYRMIKG